LQLLAYGNIRFERDVRFWRRKDTPPIRCYDADTRVTGAPLTPCHPSPVASPIVDIEVVRSDRRKKTVQARLIGDVLRVAIPNEMSRSEELHWVALMRSKFELRAASQPIDLTRRAHRLAGLYGLPRPDSIRWVHNQRSRWGSCTPEDRTIRVSSRVAEFPDWVLDYLIVHELAHLSERGHGKTFWALVDRYPRAERARGFLIAMGREWNENGHTDVAT